MSDQAEKLRQLVLTRQAMSMDATVSPAGAALVTEFAAETPLPRPTRSLLITTIRGEVGSSSSVLKPAVELGELGRMVVRKHLGESPSAGDFAQLNASRLRGKTGN